MKEVICLLVRVSELKYKDVINVVDGQRLGVVSDLEFDCRTARVTALIIYGHSRFFGFLGREEDTVICWEQIKVIGDDAILVVYPPPEPPHRLPDGPYRRGCG